ncbi:MAG: alpha-L-rhamnosidase C-terminal domain-containing protein [Capsulimonadales bacterium]|nr:alpha-L-rhamnosidase C-terminal domain-containing protein [Capsulimonadales bacterium]
MLSQRWPAAWCRYPGGPHTSSAVFLFRKSLHFETVPERFLLHLSADQRYRLLVNGQPIAWGPARGDLYHWRFESVDIAPFLRTGENVLAVQVHFMDTAVAPLAQITWEAALVVQGDTEAESAVNTPEEWRVHRCDAFTFSLEDMRALSTYCSVGPSEILDCRRFPYGWDSPGFDVADWPTTERVNRSYSAPYGLEDGETNWWLVPRSIPMMEEIPEPFGRIVRIDGEASTGENRYFIPAHRTVRLLFDKGHLTCAFPEIRIREGNGAKLRLAYAESLLPADAKPWELGRKGDRNETEGRVLLGYADYWIADGDDRLLRPLWWKTYRYAELTVETADAPLTIEGIRAIVTGYPWEEKAKFVAPELPDVDRIWEVGWRTIRRCTHETYMDCPYYEQLQYVGDTRIQALVTQYVTGDSRLFRNALSQMFDSRLPDGLTHSRYPSRIPQIIAPFSLWWVCMVADYALLVPDETDFLRSMMPGIRSVLGWFLDRVDPQTGLLGELEWWCFGDWTRGWRFGTPPGAKEGGSAFMTLQLALALEAAELVAAVAGPSDEMTRYRRLRERMVKAVRTRCYEAKEGRVADTPAKTSYSQHSSILAILTDVVPKNHRRRVMERVLSDPDMPQATFYFRFYLNRALVKAGLGDRYPETLGPWRDMLVMGLSTWAENPEPTRSDCHAWSASPNYEFLATVLGILPYGPGFVGVELRPHLGSLTKASGSMPHPRGRIQVAYRRDGDRLNAEFAVPDGIDVFLTWRNETRPFFGGGQHSVILGE